MRTVIDGFLLVALYRGTAYVAHLAFEEAMSFTGPDAAGADIFFVIGGWILFGWLARLLLSRSHPWQSSLG